MDVRNIKPKTWGTLHGDGKTRQEERPSKHGLFLGQQKCLALAENCDLANRDDDQNQPHHNQHDNDQIAVREAARGKIFLHFT